MKYLNAQPELWPLKRYLRTEININVVEKVSLILKQYTHTQKNQVWSIQLIMDYLACLNSFPKIKAHTCKIFSHFCRPEWVFLTWLLLMVNEGKCFRFFFPKGNMWKSSFGCFKKWGPNLKTSLILFKWVIVACLPAPSLPIATFSNYLSVFVSVPGLSPFQLFSLSEETAV